LIAYICKAKIKNVINKLITNTQRSLFEGIGKAEPLKENLAGFWSRCVDDSSRLVYVVDDNKLTIISCRYHYENDLIKRSAGLASALYTQG